MTLIAHAGDATSVIDVFASPESKGGKSVRLKGHAKTALLAGRDLGRAHFGDFMQRVEFTVQTDAAKPVCQVTLMLLAEHDTDTANLGSALLVIDSLDLSFVASNQGQYGR